MPVTIANKIEIAISAEDLFNYVTQPWLWHEWHPSSQSANAAQSFLAAGDEFDEVIVVQPLGPLPPSLTRNTHYTVTEAIPSHSWKVEGKMKDGWLKIRYDFKEPAEKPGTTLFQRTLSFGVTGPTRLLLPFLNLKMKRISRRAMNDLKNRLESL